MNIGSPLQRTQRTPFASPARCLAWPRGVTRRTHWPRFWRRSWWASRILLRGGCRPRMGSGSGVPNGVATLGPRPGPGEGPPHRRARGRVGAGPRGAAAPRRPRGRSGCGPGARGRCGAQRLVWPGRRELRRLRRGGQALLGSERRVGRRDGRFHRISRSGKDSCFPFSQRVCAKMLWYVMIWHRMLDSSRVSYCTVCYSTV